MSKKNPTDRWKSRIVGEGEEHPEQLLANPMNWRIHGKYQQETLQSVLDSVGWVQRVIVNKTTGHVVDGHLRVELAISNNEPVVPVLYVELSEAEEKLVLATLDPIAEMAGTDSEKLEALVKDMRGDATLDRELTGELGDMLGYEDEEFAKDALEGSEADDRVELGKFGMNAYCSFHDKVDVGKGPCTIGCMYCFTLVTKASLHWAGKNRPVDQRDLKRAVKECAAGSNLLTVGICNEPTQSAFMDNLEYLMRECKDAGVYLRVQTKNPVAMMTLVEKVKPDPELIGSFVSFGTCNQEDASRLEPGAPPLKARVEGLKRLVRYGGDACVRFSPFWLGRHEGRQELLMSCKGANRCIVEPIRISRTSIHYFERVQEVLPWFNIDEYFEKYGRKDIPFYGAHHWYDYSYAALYSEFNLIKGMAAKAGMQFGICNAPYGWPMARLNDGPVCCSTPNIEKHSPYDKNSLACVVCTGRLKKLHVPSLAATNPGSPEREMELVRVQWANDPMNPLCPAEGPKE